MKYMIINDVLMLLRKFKKAILFLFLIFASHFYIQLFKISSIDIKFVKKILGLEILMENDWIAFLVFLFSITFFVLVGSYLFFKDFHYGREYLFLRIRRKTWVFYKILNILTITIIIKFVIYIFFIILFLFNNINLNYLLINFIFDFILSICFEIVSISIILIIKKIQFKGV